MRVAVVGAGFAGLAVAWFLAQKAEVVVFDPLGIGGGASGMAAGLVHPYVGEEVRRSYLADESMEEMGALMDLVEGKLGMPVCSRGLVRMVADERKWGRLEGQPDVKTLGEGRFLVTSGRVVNCPLYLQGLWSLIEGKGGRLVREKVEDLGALQGFDAIVVAAGAWSGQIVGPLPASVLKGQVLVCRAKEAGVLPEMSLVGKGYMAVDGMTCYLGSTYERGFVDKKVDMGVCQEIILPKIAAFFPRVDELEIVEARASLRLCAKGHREGVPDYFPLMRKEKEGIWVLTGMGSRGLLYHALLGKRMAEEI